MTRARILLITWLVGLLFGCSTGSNPVVTQVSETEIPTAAALDALPPTGSMIPATGTIDESNRHDSQRLANLGQEITKPVRLLADTQFHESRGTASRFFSRAGDEFVPVTIRTGQQVVGGADILYETLVARDNTLLTLHLGDAIDVSCQTEWDSFSRVMELTLGKPGPRTWLFTPGNHDGFLVGNFYPLKDGRYNQQHWSYVCNAGRVVTNEKIINDSIRKPALIASYVDRLPWPPNHIRSRGRDAFCLADKSFCAAYAIDEAEWASYLIQLVHLPAATNDSHPVYALMLDTSDYPTRPYIWPGYIHAGTQAGLSQAQLHAALALLERLPEGARFFIAGHHPWKDWRSESWKSEHTADLEKILLHAKFLNLLVSAHTHEGRWEDQKLGSAQFTELNIGSLIDSPLYYRTLSFFENSAGDVAVKAERILIDEDFSVDCARFVGKGTGPGYSVREQRTFAEKYRSLPAFIRAKLSVIPALGKFFTFWRQKHEELTPQLLVYADVVDVSMPTSENFSYRPQGKSGRIHNFSNSAALSARLRYLGNCYDKTKCSIREKGHLLLALDDYYWNLPTKSTDFSNGHAARFCFATRSALEAGTYTRTPGEVLKRTVETTRVVKRNNN